jgi:hypothetical protein
MKAIELASVKGIGAYDFPCGIRVLKGIRQNYIDVYGFEWKGNSGGTAKHRIKVTPEQAITMTRIIIDKYNPFPNMPYGELTTAFDYLKTIGMLNL